MPIKVRIPTMLLKLTGNKTEISVTAKTVRDLILRMDKKYPGMKDLILSPDETAINHHFLICINEEDVRYLQDLETPLSNGDHVEIVASIAGGSGKTGHPRLASTLKGEYFNSAGSGF